MPEEIHTPASFGFVGGHIVQSDQHAIHFFARQLERLDHPLGGVPAIFTVATFVFLPNDSGP
jgi:hypothetical protein